MKIKAESITHVGSRGSSVVDYVVSSQHLFNHVSNFRIESPTISLSLFLSFSFSLSVIDYITGGYNGSC